MTAVGIIPTIYSNVTIRQLIMKKKKAAKDIIEKALNLEKALDDERHDLIQKYVTKIMNSVQHDIEQDTRIREKILNDF